MVLYLSAQLSDIHRLGGWSWGWVMRVNQQAESKGWQLWIF